MKTENLTVKQNLFIKELIKTLSPTEAAMRVYNCKDRLSARVIASQNLSKLNISMVELMDKMGLGLEEDIADLKRLRKAKRVTGYIRKRGKKGKKKKAIEIKVDDNQTQLKALELSLKVAGHLKEKTEHSFDDSTKHLLNKALTRLKND